MKNMFFLAFLIFASLPVFSQNDSLYKSSVSEIMALPVIVKKKTVVSASRTEEDINFAPATVYVITEEDIANNHYYNLKDVLQNVAGVVPINLDFFLFGGQRGSVSNFSQTLLMINGREVQNLIASETFISNQFATHNIKQIEIMQGPSSALYGANALVGIINIITKTEDNSFQKINVQVESGTQNTKAVSIVFGKNIGNWRVSGSLRYAKTDNWNFTDFVNDTSRFSSGYSNIARSVANDQNKFLNRSESTPYSLYVAYKGFYAGTEGYYLQTGKGLEGVLLDYNNSRDYRVFGLYYAGWKHSFNDKQKISIEYQYSNETFWGRHVKFNQSIFDSLVKAGRSPSQPIGLEEANKYFTDIYSQEHSDGSKRRRLNLLYHGNFKNNLDLVAGYVFDQLDILGFALAKNDIVPTFNQQVSDSNRLRLPFFLTTKNAVFLQAKQVILKKLHLTLGIRYDHHSQYGGVFNLRSGLVYNPLPNTFVKFLFGQAFREPNIFELGAQNPTFNLTLKPARINAYELSFTQNIQEKAQFFLTLYRNEISGQIVPSTTYDFVNSNGITGVWGIESKITYHDQNLNADLNYTFTKPDAQFAGGQTVDYLNNYPHRINFGLSYKLFKYLRINPRINYYSAMTAVEGNPIYSNTQLNQINSFTDVNLTLSTGTINLKGLNVRFQISATNLLDGEWYQPNVRKGGPKQFMQAGRQFLGRLTFEL